MSTIVYIKDDALGGFRPLAAADFAYGGSTTDRELAVTTYRCKTAFTGASVNDTIRSIQIIDVSGSTPTTVATIWRNETTAADLASAPSAANIELTASDALTNAQLRAAAVVSQSQWEDGSYTLDSSGDLVSETQINSGTGATRTRAWTYAAQPDGSVVATPGAWA